MRRVTPTVPPVAPVAERVLTTAEAARLLKVSPDTLLGLDVPFVAIGTGRKRPRRRYLESSVIEWFRRRQAPSADVCKPVRRAS